MSFEASSEMPSALSCLLTLSKRLAATFLTSGVDVFGQMHHLEDPGPLVTALDSLQDFPSTLGTTTVLAKLGQSAVLNSSLAESS